MFPLKMVVLETLRLSELLSVAAPEKSRVPELVESPMFSAPERSRGLDKVRAPVLSLESAPPEKVREPLPRAVAVPTWILPALRNTPPLKAALVPLKVRVLDPLFTRAPLPLNSPLKTVVPEVPASVRELLWRRTVPAPAREPMVSEAASLRRPAEPRVSAMESMSAEPPERVSVPALTEVVPLKELVPPRVSSEAPSLVSEVPVPARALERTTGLMV